MKHATSCRSRYKWASYSCGSLRFRARRDDWYHPSFEDGLPKPVGIIPFVRDHILALITGDQHIRLGDVMHVSAGQDKPQGIAETVHAHVDLRAETAAAAAQGQGFLPAPFWGCASGTGVGPDHRAVNDELLHIRVVSEAMVHLSPDAAVGPTGKSLVHAVPMPIRGRQQPPLGRRSGSSTGHPQ